MRISHEKKKTKTSVARMSYSWFSDVISLCKVWNAHDQSLQIIHLFNGYSPCWIPLKVFDKIQSVYLGHFYFHITKLRKKADLITVISLLSALFWAPTWRIATVVKAEVTWVKTKNSSEVGKKYSLARSGSRYVLNNFFFFIRRTSYSECSLFDPF